jgi:hypothetical protein
MAGEAKSAERMFSFLLRRQKGEPVLFKPIKDLLQMRISTMMRKGI